MPKVILYIASTLDGFIARENGGIDFLKPFEEMGTDYGYNDFIATIDALVMGSHTYEQALTFGDWPHAGTPTYVFTHRQLPQQQDVFSWDDTPEALMHQLRDLKNIWLVGGTELITSFMNAGLVNELIISTIPVIIGSGIPLFKNIAHPYSAKNVIVKQYGDVVQTSSILIPTKPQ